jgi:hypothetical protein
MEVEGGAKPGPMGEPSTTSRREFVGAVGRKALYIAPIILALRAQQAFASTPSVPSCLWLGATCMSNAECCSNNCVNDMGNSTCVA